MLDLSGRRDRERAKYEGLATDRPDYFSTNHGKDAFHFVKELVCERDNVRLIDFGCGDNSFVKQLRELKIIKQAEGVDWVDRGADHVVPMYSTGLDNASANIITAFDSLEHLLPEDVPLVLEEMHRLCFHSRDNWHPTFVFSISFVPSKILYEGENLHPTVRSRIWWVTMIEHFGEIVQGRDSGKYIVGRWKEFHTWRP